MTRPLLIILLAISLTGCSGQPSLRANTEESVKLAAVASLAEPWDLAVTPYFTRLAGQETTAAKLIKRGKLPVEIARTIQSLADQARALIGKGKSGPSLEAGVALSQAAVMQDQIDQLLRGAL